MQHMGMAGHQDPTPTVTQQHPEIQPQITPLKINITGIPVYHLDAWAIHALLSQTTSAAGRSTQVIAHEIKTYDVSTYFTVSEGDKQQIKNMCELKDTAVDDEFTK